MAISRGRRTIIAFAAIAGVALASGVRSEQAASDARQQAQQPPIFRTGANAVIVDAYPRRDGRIVEGLTKDDFTLIEEGQPQRIDTLEFIRVEPYSPEVTRRDPNSQREANRLAADPRNRVFVLFLDHYHANLAGGHYVRAPIIEMLNRMLAPNDLFGMATPFTRPVDLMLGRRTTTLEAELEKHWDWGIKRKEFEPEEQAIVRCYGDQVAWAVASRMREMRTMEGMRTLIRHLGDIREARKVLLLFTDGWPMHQPDRTAADQIIQAEYGRRPQVGISTGGQLTTARGLSPVDADLASCNSEIIRAFELDNRRRFISLIEDARKANVSVYPVSLSGMTGGRTDMYWEFANNTDGGVVATNDYREGLRRVADDVSAYYVLTYSPPNLKADGSYRRIEVKVNQPGVRVQARRGYFAPEPASSPERATPAAPPMPAGLNDALGALSRLRPDATVLTRAVVDATGITVVAELASASALPKGGDVHVTLAGAAGEVGTGVGRIEAGFRSVEVRLPLPVVPGPFRASVRVTGGVDAITDRIEVAERESTIVGAPVVYRATPSLRSPLRPVADMQFRRTERVHVRWAVPADVRSQAARLLGRDGRPVAVPLEAVRRDADGAYHVTVDLNLAPLALGDYVIVLTAANAAGQTEESYVAIRVRN